MQDHAAAFGMAQETVAQAHAFMRAFDQARKIGQHEIAFVDFTTPSCGSSVVKG